MKCENCPLCKGDWDYYTNDGDIYCLVTGDYVDEERGCTRTNKWINSQNPETLKKRLLEQEAERWSEYVKQYAEYEDGRFDYPQNL